jgi:deazaflavin-dependent oxidoreductase (nitroreductase family)
VNAEPGDRHPEQPAPPRGLLGWLFKLPAYLFRLHLGFLFGHRFVVLVHEGRRTHRRYETPLEVISYNGSTAEAIVAAGWGRKTSWLHNIEAGLAREVWIGRERYKPAWRRLPVDEAVSVLEAYEKRSGIPQPIVRAVLSRLLGWSYDGTRESRRRAAEQLPMLGFRPGGEAGSGTR